MVPANAIDAYVNAREIQAQHQNEINGHQPNDPKKAASVFISLSEQEHPPVHFFRGVGAAAFVEAKIRVIEQALEDN